LTHAQNCRTLLSNTRQQNSGVFAISLILLGGNTGSGGSPRLYQDGEDYLVQGYAVTDPQLLAELNIPDGEAVVRVPQTLWKYLPLRRLISQFG